MVNTQLLDEKIADSGIMIKRFINELGISRNGFDKKRKGKIPFRKSEIYVLKDLLKLTDEQRDEIFFTDEVGP